MEFTPTFTPEEKKLALQADIDSLRIQLPLLIEHTKMFASLTRAKYQGLVDAGFTKNEALTLCKNI